MNIVSYIHPTRTYQPCTGIGKHMNNMLLGLKNRDDMSLSLLFSQQWLTLNGRLDSRSPLHSLPFTTFPSAENPTERKWKLMGFPRMDRYVPQDTDWLYTPMETYIPLTKCPVAVTIHDIQAFETDLLWSNTWKHRWFAYKWSQWVQKTLNDCRVVFTVSEFAKQRMVALLGANPKKIEVIGNGVDPSFFEIAKIAPASLNLSFDRPYIMIVGGLKYIKGGDYVLAVAQTLRQRKSDLHIIVVGNSDAKYVSAVQEYPNITLLGMLADRELHPLLRCASSLLFLSLYEGFGIPALEAMAVGIPAVVSDRGSLPEIVGDAGIVVDPTNAEAIADILQDIHQIPRLRDEYIQRGHQHASIYTWNSCVDRLVNAFQVYA